MLDAHPTSKETREIPEEFVKVVKVVRERIPFSKFVIKEIRDFNERSCQLQFSIRRKLPAEVEEAEELIDMVIDEISGLAT